MDMISKVGGAALLAATEWSPKDGISKERAMGLAALEAMRTPTEAMKNAMCEVGPDTNQGEFSWDDATSIWGASIEAALSPSGEK